MNETLIDYYYQPHRKYHDIRHIQWMLMEFGSMRPLCRRPDDVETAIWFHDAVYDPMAKDNEEQSVALARDFLGKGMTSEIERLIMLTKHDKIPAADDIDGQVIVDCDLAILGTEKPLYDAYEQGIRQEYRLVPDDKYREGRTKVLTSFFSRKPGIYCTDSFISRYEARAKLNISQACRRLNENGLDALARAIEKARGGPAPPPMMRAFA